MAREEQAAPPFGGAWRTWPGDETGGTALVRPDARSRPHLEAVQAAGFRRARTGALTHEEAAPLLRGRWTVAAHLHLLRHSLEKLPPEHPRSGPRLRRASEHDLDAATALDDESFPAEWRLGRPGLADALRATPHTRFRLARHELGPAGYAICGRAGREGYVQRLAVASSSQRQGLGRALTLDALRWLRRWRAQVASVNTYAGNDEALSLYRSLGFVEAPRGLMVLTISL